jgi:Rrf2 family transcriptional regulator, cysteine metabolism repressor
VAIVQVSQKCQYTLRALFELAKRQGAGPVSVADIAEAQAIPRRFLELIFLNLRSRGVVESRRGNQGGYVLTTSPARITVGDIIRAVDGSLSPVTCAGGKNEKHCRLKNRCIFADVWQRATRAAEEVYDKTTLQDLIDNERTAAGQDGLLVQVA